MPSINIDKSISAYIFLVTIIFVSLISFAASDIRGTDQYWYTADVETLLVGGKTTNNVYPAQLMSPETQIPCPFMHNILNLYLVLPLAKVFGAFWGWVITNIIATVLTAMLIALLVAMVADKWVSALTYTLYLLLPLTVWQSSQPLAEATIAPFVALGVLAYIRAKTNKKLWGIALVAACAAYYCRLSFLPILFVIPIAYLVQSRPLRTRNVLPALGLLSLSIFIIIIGKMIFVQGMPTSFGKMIVNAIPGVNRNMDFLFSLSPRPITTRELWLKISAPLSYQLLPRSRSSQIFYLPFNLLTVLSLYLYFTKKTPKEARIAHCVAVLLLLHIATIIIHQNQFRYLLVITPAVLAGSAVILNKIKFLQSKRRQLGLLMVLAIFLTASNVPIVTRLRKEGFRERKLRTALSSTFDNTIAKDESVIVDASNEYNQILGYVLRPRLVIFVDLRYKDEEYQAMREKGNAKWLLCPIESPLIKHFHISSPPTLKDLPHPYKDYALFQL
jgi:hypothetical protein